MTDEEVKALVVENQRLRAEVAEAAEQLLAAGEEVEALRQKLAKMAEKFTRPRPRLGTGFWG